MPKKTTKSTTKRKTNRIVKSTVMEPVFEPEVTMPESFPQETVRQNRSALYGVIVVILVIIGIVLFKNGLLVAALVDGKPIFSWQLSQEMMKHYGKQTLDTMITEQIIASQGNKSNITVSQADIDAREQEMIKQFGPNVKLDDLLQYQGITKADLDKQMKVQLIVEKIISKDLKITATDVANYIASNSGKFTATDEASLNQEARNALTAEEISKKIQPWFEGVKQSSKIVKFVN
jgi:foldase protein PrsA